MASEPPPVRSRLPSIVIRLGWISLFTDIASEMATPLIPLFLVTLSASPGLAVGLVDGGAHAFAALTSAVSGWHSDRLRRRVPYVRAGYGLALASKALLALAATWPIVLALRLADRFGKGLRGAPRDALLTDVAGDQRGAAFGLHRAMDTTGALIGCLLAAALLAWIPGEYRTVFALTAIPGVAAVVLTFTLREPAEAKDAGAAAEVSTVAAAGTPAPAAVPGVSTATSRVSAAALPRAYWAAAAVLWLFSLSGVSEAFLLLRANEQGLTDMHALLAYAVFNAVYALAAYPAGRSSDRLGRPRLLAAGWLLFALAMLGAMRLEGAAMTWLFPLLGLHLGLTHGVGRAWVADRAPAALRGTALGVFQLGTGLGLLAGAAVAGLLWDRIAPTAAFQFGLVVGLVALTLLPLASRTRPSGA